MDQWIYLRWIKNEKRNVMKGTDWNNERQRNLNKRKYDSTLKKVKLSPLVRSTKPKRMKTCEQLSLDTWKKEGCSFLFIHILEKVEFAVKVTVLRPLRNVRMLVFLYRSSVNEVVPAPPPWWGSTLKIFAPETSRYLTTQLVTKWLLIYFKFSCW